MNWLISDAWAQGSITGGQGGYVSLIMLGGMFAVFWFLLIRPQQKRAKEHKAMIESLAKGDEVVTSGGVLGRVTQLGPSYVSVEIADKVEIKVQRPAIQTVLPKGTLKAAND
ncbi:MAG TPA: preprotein translocase subunit YajC [Burkholderiales bacterium]|jgi:preprotein translocase subunit YajC|nr:preprotein translocase subunit YajC [Burkholderiales bacterium]